jgi:hypothetical protein
MKKKQKKLKPHARQRLHERSNFAEFNLTQTEIAEKINKNTITFVKKLTTSRSLGYTNVNGCPFKVVYSKTSDCVVTFLPLSHDYEFIQEVCSDDKKYRLIIYPDCYNEIKNSRVMTKFQESSDNSWKDLETKGEAFTVLFNLVWNNYLKGKENEI